MTRRNRPTPYRNGFDPVLDRIDQYLDTQDDPAPDCPFCDYPVDELSDGRYACGRCEISWQDAAEIERDRRTLAAAPFWGMED